MEKKKKVFISGPMSGIKDFNKPAFDRVEQWLTQAGYSVFNPARMHFDDAWSHEEIMRIDLAALAQCDYICMLGGWESSIGAMHEYRYAMATGIEMFHSCYIEHPKKEEKTQQRIEIESFGDISGENIVFLTWVEKHVNEILASGRNITEVQIKHDTECVKRCAGCKYHKCAINEEPCKSCNPNHHTNWEPKPTSDAPIKSCNTCKYVNYKMLEEPCKSCTGPFQDSHHTNWEPKEEK